MLGLMGDGFTHEGIHQFLTRYHLNTTDPSPASIVTVNIDILTGNRQAGEETQRNTGERGQPLKAYNKPLITKHASAVAGYTLDTLI